MQEDHLEKVIPNINRVNGVKEAKFPHLPPRRAASGRERVPLALACPPSSGFTDLVLGIKEGFRSLKLSEIVQVDSLGLLLPSSWRYQVLGNKTNWTR